MDFPIGVKQSRRSARLETVRPIPKGKLMAASADRVYFTRMRKRPYREVVFNRMFPAQLFPYKPAKQSIYDSIREYPIPDLPVVPSFVPEILDDQAHCRQIHIPTQKARCWREELPEDAAKCEQVIIPEKQAECWQELIPEDAAECFQIEIPRQEARCWQETIPKYSAFCNQIFFFEREAECTFYRFKQNSAKCMVWGAELPSARCDEIRPSEPEVSFTKAVFESREARSDFFPISLNEAAILSLPLVKRQAACALFDLREPEFTRAYTIPKLTLEPQKHINRFIFGLSHLRFYSLKAQLPCFETDDLIAIAPEDLLISTQETVVLAPEFQYNNKPEFFSLDSHAMQTMQPFHDDIKIDPELEKMLLGPTLQTKTELLQTGEMPVVRARRYDVDCMQPAKTHNVPFSKKAASAKRQRLIDLFQQPPIICVKKEDKWFFYLDLQNVSNIKAIYLNNMEVAVGPPVPIELTSNHIKLVLHNNGKFSSKIGGDRSYYWFKLNKDLESGMREENPMDGNYLLVVPADWKCDNPEAKCFIGLPQQHLGLEHWKGYRVHVNSKNSEFPKFRLFNGMTRMCRWQTTFYSE
ncbi:hypothetical protein KC799_23715 [candidate division KSB1 bacterium]|nr:hypothetical protein [candidate division KSB1 bacterium]